LEKIMAQGGKSNVAGKLETALTWAVIFYLLAWIFDWLIQRKWGLFFILTFIATVGWGFLISPILYYAMSDTDGGTAIAISLPLGAISENSPSSGFSAAKMTRNGAPFHGATGDGKTASSAASSHLAAGPWARASRLETRRVKDATAISHDADTEAAKRREIVT